MGHNHCLKKIITILLLAIHVFNLAGYSLLFQFLIRQNSKQAIQHIDKGEYTDRELVQVKIPYPLPYSTNWKDYERYDGEIEFAGVHYNYVKRRIYNDTLYLLCLPDINRTRLHDARNNYAEQVNDINTASSGKKGEDGAKKNILLSEYEQQETLYAVPLTLTLSGTGNNFITPFLQTGQIDRPGQPPELSI